MGEEQTSSKVNPTTPSLQYSSSSPPSHLILFDIDGTLLDLHGAGRLAFSRTLTRVFGWENDLAHINFAGATDLVVLRRLMVEHGHEGSPEDEARFFTALPSELEQTIPGSDATLHPGVHELLEKLSADPRCLLGLVTGNIRACAMLKLRPFGLERYFASGGFGDDHSEREAIARLAVQRAMDLMGNGHKPGQTVLVGDALSDVRAARAIGALSIAVGTGWHASKDLLEAGADHLVEDLSDTARVVEMMGLA